jgi:hypothetical protein
LDNPKSAFGDVVWEVKEGLWMVVKAYRTKCFRTENETGVPQSQQILSEYRSFICPSAWCLFIVTSCQVSG